MAKVNLTQGLWKVTLVERERGYGQRIIWVEYYDNETEARARAEAASDYRDPEDYYVGEVSKC
jgi:hypothetical protein